MPIRSRKTLFKVFVIIVSNWTERCLTAQSVLKTKQRFTKMEKPEVSLVIRGGQRFYHSLGHLSCYLRGFAPGQH